MHTSYIHIFCENGRATVTPCTHVETARLKEQTLTIQRDRNGKRTVTFKDPWTPVDYEYTIVLKDGHNSYLVHSHDKQEVTNKFHEKIEKLQETIKKKDNTIQELRGDNEEKDNTIQKLREDKKELQETIKTLRGDKNELQETIKTLRGDMDPKNADTPRGAAPAGGAGAGAVTTDFRYGKHLIF